MTPSLRARAEQLRSNPLLTLHGATGGRSDSRAEAIRTYAFAVPSDAALDLIQRVASSGIVEIGAGTGYWAALLAVRGVDVVAYDPAPAPSSDNHLFAGRQPWYDVRVGDEHAVAAHVDRTLLLVWPTFDEAWPANVVERYYRRGGKQVIYVGEPAGGLTGDARFHALVGMLEHCFACAYGLLDNPCVCGTESIWKQTQTMDIPRWEGCDDGIYLFERVEPGSGHQFPSPFRRRRWVRRKGVRA